MVRECEGPVPAVRPQLVGNPKGVRRLFANQSEHLVDVRTAASVSQVRVRESADLAFKLLSAGLALWWCLGDTQQLRSPRVTLVPG